MKTFIVGPEYIIVNEAKEVIKNFHGQLLCLKILIGNTIGKKINTAF